MNHHARRTPAALALLAILMALPCARAAAQDNTVAPKPKAAFFPLGGNGDEKLRERVTFALRQKLDRDGSYEVLDGYKMKDIAADQKDLSFDTDVKAIMEMNSVAEAQILVWGDLDQQNHLRLKILDLRQKDAQADTQKNPRPREMSADIAHPTDLRFAAEKILATLPDVKEFEHPSEEPVTDDAQSRELWKKNPNLVLNGDFAKPGLWSGIYESEYYPVEIHDALPAPDKVSIYQLPAAEGEKAHRVLAMNLSRECAENNGLACLSDAIKIEPNTRYRISFRYKSDGPTLHVFVKGYTTGKDVKGNPAPREVYRRQVPPSGGTNGKWVTVVDDLNPQNISWPVETLKVDLYAYLSPGTVMFDDVQLRAVGSQTRRAHDDAIKPKIER